MRSKRLPVRVRARDRRAFLTGTAGVTMGLPLLDALSPRRAAGATARPRAAVFVMDVNGVVQASVAEYAGGAPEPETFWPRAPGPLTRVTLEADRAMGRVLGELADFAERLLIVRGVNHPFQSRNDPHAGGANQVLTASSLLPAVGNVDTVPRGESLDVRLAREENPPGQGPFNLAYLRSNWEYVNTRAISYQGNGKASPFEVSPAAAYARMMQTASLDAAGAERLARGRRSVNDFVREQMRALMAAPALSTSDRRRLEQHFTAIRDVETRIAANLSVEQEQELARLGGAYQTDAARDSVVRLHMDIIALALGAGYTTVATLRIEETNQALDGYKEIYPYHWISHRILSDAFHGAPLAGALEMHRRVNVIQANRFKYLLTRLAEQTTPYGSLLDESVAAWTNQIGTGNHSYRNIPWVMAGGAGGTLKRGVYLDLPSGGVTSNKFLNALGTALGLRNGAGGALDDFGDPSLPKGILSEILT